MPNQLKINKPFDVTYTISFSGRTKVDGETTITSMIIRDKMLAVLEDMLTKGFIREYRISAEINNIQSEEKTIKRASETE